MPRASAGHGPAGKVRVQHSLVRPVVAAGRRRREERGVRGGRGPDDHDAGVERVRRHQLRGGGKGVVGGVEG
jgi:hypothetical protein